MRSPSATPAATTDVGRIERLGPNQARLEILRLDMAPNDGLSIAAAHDGVAVDDDAGRGLAALRGDRDGLADADASLGIDDRELQHGGLLLQRAAPTLEAELHREISPDQARSRASASRDRRRRNHNASIHSEFGSTIWNSTS